MYYIYLWASHFYVKGNPEKEWEKYKEKHGEKACEDMLAFLQILEIRKANHGA